MFKLKMWEHSPRVTLLQILLKDEHPLHVDGVFGPKTLAAVNAYQSARGEIPLGLPSPTTWENLLQGTDLAIVSSIDAGDPELAMYDRQALEAVGDKPILLAAMCNGLGQLVREVNGRSGGKKIAALRLDGHGNLGQWMTVSVGEAADLHVEHPKEYAKVAGEYFSYIDARHFAQIAPLLGQLSTRFSRFGFAEHHGCSLGRRPETRRMMAKLADLWGVPVSVGMTLQPFGVIADFAGPVYTAFPHGSDLRSWSQQFQDEIVRTMSYIPSAGPKYPKLPGDVRAW